MTKILSTILALIVVVALLVPSIVSATGDDTVGTSSLIVCGVDTSGNGILEDNEMCNFENLVELGVNIIDFLIKLTTLVATAAFVWVGLLLLTSGGDEKKKNEAKAIAMKVLKGYLWVMFAWLLVYTVLNVLVEDKFSILGDFGT